jgi:hypothetical protein
MGAIPIDGTVFTLANLARAAATRGQGAFSDFYRNLTEIEQVQLREIGAELAALTNPLPNYSEPISAAHAAFSKLLWKTETTLNRHVARQVFSKWLEILGPKLDKKSGVNHPPIDNEAGTKRCKARTRNGERERSGPARKAARVG